MTALPILPEDASLFTRLRLAARSLMVLKDDPGHTHYGPLVNACLDTGTYTTIAATWRETERGRALLETRPSLQGPDLDLDVLEALPTDTFGHAFAQYFRSLGVEPFVSDFPQRNDVDYLSKRYRETHDIVHVITGYKTDDYSEMELQAFVYGNLGLTQNVFIIITGVFVLPSTVGLRRMLHYAGDIWRAYRRGQQSRELLSVDYESMWSMPLAEVQAMLVAPAR